MKNLSKNSKKTFNQIFSHKFNKNFLKALFWENFPSKAWNLWENVWLKYLMN
jgi:hypothetical protein